MLTANSLSPLGPEKTGAVWKIVPADGIGTAGNQTTGNQTSGNITGSGQSPADFTSGGNTYPIKGYAFRAW